MPPLSLFKSVNKAHAIQLVWISGSRWDRNRRYIAEEMQQNYYTAVFASFEIRMEEMEQTLSRQR